MVHGNEPSDIRRLSDLRRAQSGDRTLQNLVELLSAKLELSARLPVFEYEARSQGHERCAQTFQRLAQAERRSFDELLDCVRDHIDETRARPDMPAGSRL